MQWYYVQNEKQTGPVSEEDIRRLFSNGDISEETPVRNETMTEWSSYRNVFDDDNIAREPCSMCGKETSTDDLIEFEGAWVCADCKPAFLQQIKENAEISGKNILRYAGFWCRFGAIFIDGLLIAIFNIPANIMFQYSMRRIAEGNKSPFIAWAIILYALMLILPAIYIIWMTGKYGATLGKKALGIKVIMSDKRPLTYGRATGRYFANMLSSFILNIGYLMAAFDKEKRALHDHICNTRVVYKDAL